MGHYNYEYLLSQIAIEGKRIYGDGFAIHYPDLPVIHKLLAYVLQDEATATRLGVDLHKGIMLSGRVGCGKTSLICILRKLSSESFKPVIKSCREISIEFCKQGYDIIARYSTNAFHPYSSIPRVYCFDDLGLETSVNYWGDKWNVMAEILLSRYDLFISHKMITHVTTNLNADELEVIYGDWLRSRMRAMFNLIAFDPGTTDKRR